MCLANNHKAGSPSGAPALSRPRTSLRGKCPEAPRKTLPGGVQKR
ncbi:hypothetical protein NMD1_01147 [Novosphingobium sp. MD-1]|nr:hypothetical protein NMD1_01147 [Novosphingobium sp. MD-1]